MKVKIADIIVDYSMNAREELNPDTIVDYAKIFDQLPPVVVFDVEDESLLLADGFHRVGAAEKLGRNEIEADIKKGNRKDATIYALSANAKRGLPLTREEIREATKDLLRECTERSDSWIAEDMGVSKNTVAKYRDELESGCQIDRLEKLIGKDGKEYPRKIKQPSWRDNASDTLLGCVDADVFSKDVGKALIKYPLEAQDVIAGQIEQMKERPPSGDILDWIQKFEEIDDDILVAFLTGSFRIKYFDDIYALWAEDDPTLELIDFIGEHERQFVAFDPVFKEAYCVTSHNCIIKGVSDFDMTKTYHPVMRMMERANLVGSPGDIYKVSFRQLFLDDDVAYSALVDEGIRISRDWDYMFSAVIEAKDSLRVQSPIDWNETTVKLIHPVISKIADICIGHNFVINQICGHRICGPIAPQIHTAPQIQPITPQRCVWRLTSTPDLFVDEDVVWKLAEKYDFDFEIVEGGFEDECPEGETDSGHAGPFEQSGQALPSLVDLNSPIDGEQMDKDFLEANPEARVGEEEGEVPDVLLVQAVYTSLNKKPDFREKLARLCHTQWSGWMTYLFSKGDRNDDGTWTMPAWAVERWTLQMNTSYSELSDAEKDSDRTEADKFIELMAL